MANFKFGIGFEGYVNKINQKSVDDAMSVLDKYVKAHGSQLRKAFDLPLSGKTSTDEFQKKFEALDATITNIKDNIATIKFKTPTGMSELTADLSNAGKLKVIQNVNTEYKDMASSLVNLKTRMAQLRKESEATNEQLDELDSIENKIIEINKYGGDSPLISMLGGDVVGIKEVQNDIGEITSRTVTLRGEGQKLYSVMQSVNEETGDFSNSVIKTNDEISKTVKYASSVQKKIEDFSRVQSNTERKDAFENLSDSLKKIDIYADGAVESIEDLEKRVKDLSQEFKEQDESSKIISEISSRYKVLSDRMQTLNPRMKNFNNINGRYMSELQEAKSISEDENVARNASIESLKRILDGVKSVDAAYSSLQQKITLYKTALKQLEATEISLARVKTEATMSKDTSESTQSRINALTMERDKIAALVDVRKKDLQQTSAAKEANAQYEITIAKVSAEKDKLNKKIRESTSFLSNFAGGMKEAAARVLNYTITYRALWAAVRVIRGSVEIIQEMNSAFTNIQMVTLGTKESIAALRDEYSKLAQELSTTTTEVASGADAWLRQGKSADETMKLLKASTVLAKIGFIDAADSTEYLTSTLNGMQLSAEDAMSVVDKMSQVDIKSASSVEDLAVALQRSANSARNAGVSMDTLLGYIAAVKETTQRSASTIGEAFKTIFARMGSIAAGKFIDEDTESEFTDFNSMVNDTEKALSKVGISLRDTNSSFRNAEDVISDVASRWKTFTDVEKSGISTAMAGTRQREMFIALNYLGAYGRNAILIMCLTAGKP